MIEYLVIAMKRRDAGNGSGSVENEAHMGLDTPRKLAL
jgi:hypothetical protein